MSTIMRVVDNISYFNEQLLHTYVVCFQILQLAYDKLAMQNGMRQLGYFAAVSNFHCFKPPA